MIGQTIAHYTILEKLGEGGMGVVYKARDTKLDRDVALKFLPDRIISSPDDLTRFSQEAKAAAALSHPNICTIFGIDESEGRNFIVMEYVDGQMLEEKKHSLTQKQALEIGIQIAEGLAAAHEKGIVHRDIKPENIMVRKDGRVQIMDFGLAKLRGASRLTKEGSTVGTAGYMSPEQVQGHETDHRSDIFSLGVLLYEMFTGQPPFKGVHETAISYEIVNVDPPPMETIRPDLGPDLDSVVLDCLAKDPAERYQSVAELARNLRRVKRESSKTRLSRTVAARTFADTQRDRPVAGAGARRVNLKYLWPVVSSILLLAVAILLWRPWKSEQFLHPVMRFSVVLPDNASLQFNTGLIDFSADGKRIVFSGGAGGNSQLYIRQTDNLGIQPVSGTAGAVYPAFSPDGQWIAYEVNGTLMKISTFGGAAQKLCDLQGSSRGCYWLDGNTILYGHINRGIMSVPANGGEPKPLTTLDSATGEISHRFPQVTPDGKTVIFTVKQSTITTFDDALIVAQRMDSGERKVLVRGGSYARYVPTGHLVYVRGASILAVPFNPSTLEIGSKPVEVEHGGWLNQFSGDAYLAFSHTGDLAFVGAIPVSLDNVILSMIDRRGTVRPILDSAYAFYTASISPDGQKLAVEIQGANDGIWVYHTTRKTLTRFTFGGGNSSYPVWSPDGKYIAYVAERGTAADIFRKPWDGSGPEERLTNGRNAWNLTSWSPDGKNIAFVENGDIWILPLDGDHAPYRFVSGPAGEGNPKFSPDGRWLAYDSNESGRQEVYVVPFPRRTGKFQVSSGGGSMPLWSPNGKELCFRSGSLVMAVEITGTSSFDYTAQRRLFTISPSTTLSDITRNKEFIGQVFRSQASAQNMLTVVLGWFDDLNAKVSEGK